MISQLNLKVKFKNFLSKAICLLPRALPWKKEKNLWCKNSTMGMTSCACGAQTTLSSCMRHHKERHLLKYENVKM
jgi:hypothetical protein